MSSSSTCQIRSRIELFEVSVIAKLDVMSVIHSNSFKELDSGFFSERKAVAMDQLSCLAMRCPNVVEEMRFWSLDKECAETSVEERYHKGSRKIWCPNVVEETRFWSLHKECAETSVEERNHKGGRKSVFLGFIIGACLRASPPTPHIGGPYQ